MNTFSYRGYQISYSEYGNENGRRVILVPDDGQDSTSIQSAISCMTASYRTVLIDFLGCGQSDKPPGFVSDLWHDQALQLKELFYAAGYETAILIGFGEGGCRTCAEFLRECPELAELVVFSAKSFHPGSLSPEAEGKVFVIPDSMRPAGGISWNLLNLILKQILEEDLNPCPWCGQPMVRGLIVGGRDMARWNPGMDTDLWPLEEDGFILRNRKPKGFLENLKTMFDADCAQLTAWVCFSCGKLTADVCHLVETERKNEDDRF